MFSDDEQNDVVNKKMTAARFDSAPRENRPSALTTKPCIPHHAALKFLHALFNLLRSLYF